MKPIARWIILAFALLLVVPNMALPQGRWNDRDNYYGRIENKNDAYRAGYNDGYREGRRQGGYDFRHHRRRDDRYKQYDRGYGYYGYNSRYKGEYKKGFKKGYREGYRSTYQEYRGNRWY